MARTNKSYTEKREKEVWERCYRSPENPWHYYEARKGTGFDSSETGRKSLAKEIGK